MDETSGGSGDELPPLRIVFAGNGIENCAFVDSERSVLLFSYVETRVSISEHVKVHAAVSVPRFPVSYPSQQVLDALQFWTCSRRKKPHNEPQC